MIKKKIIRLALIMNMLIILAGCSSAKDIEFSSADEAKDALNNAATIYVEGDLGNVNQEGNIKADDKVAAYLKEEGFFNSRWNVIIDGENWFYIKFVTDDPINDVEGVISGTTYGYYDENDKCLGYAQSQCITTADGDRDYYMVFLDADGNAKEYYSKEDGSVLYDKDANVIAYGDAEKNRILSDKCHVKIDMEEDCDISVEFMDKMAMYILLYSDLDDAYSD